MQKRQPVVIPAAAAERIGQQCDAGLFDLVALATAAGAARAISRSRSSNNSLLASPPSIRMRLAMSTGV